MSIHVSSWVWRHAECQDNELILLLALADMANDEGVCWPSVLSLASRCRCDVRTVQRNLAKALERGELRISQRCTEGKTNVYRFGKYHPPGTQDVTPPPGNGHFGHLPPESSDNHQITVNKPSNGARSDFALSSEETENKHKKAAKPDSFDQFRTFCLRNRLTEQDVTGLWCKWEANGWKLGREVIKSWKDAVISQRDYGYVPSHSAGNVNGKGRA